MPYRFGNVYSLSLFLSAAILLGLTIAAYRHRTERAATPLAGFLLGIGVWALGDAIRLAAPTGPAVLFWNRIAYAGIVVVPPTLLLFVLSYTGRTRWLRLRYVGALFVPSVLAYAIVLTNPSHGLWFEPASVTPQTAPPVLSEDWGVLWIVWAVYAYVVVLMVTYLMIREFVAHRAGIYRIQTGLVLFGVLLALAVNVPFVLGFLSFDPAPYVFTMSGLVFGTAIFRFQLLTTVPIARDVVLENMDSGVLVLDDEDRVADVNEQLVAMFDLDASAINGEPVESVFADYPAVQAHLDRTEQDDARGSEPNRPGETSPVETTRTDASTDGDGTTDETITVETDGGTRHYALDVSPMHDAVETYVGRVVVFTDVTRRVHRWDQLRERTAELEATNERLDRFASVVSHDLRNPLNVIISHAELADDDGDAEPDIDAIRDAATRMETMIDDVLTLAQQGETVGQTEPVAIEAVARSAWDLVDPAAATLAVDQSTTVQADATRLQALFENLFHNAITHGGSDVRVRVGTLPDGFFLEDDGVGIPPADRQQVFDAGYTTRSDGTGLGLHIVENVVDAHGWNVTVAEGTDGGTRFEVTGVESAD